MVGQPTPQVSDGAARLIAEAARSVLRNASDRSAGDAFATQLKGTDGERQDLLEARRAVVVHGRWISERVAHLLDLAVGHGAAAESAVLGEGPLAGASPLAEPEVGDSYQEEEDLLALSRALAFRQLAAKCPALEGLEVEVRTGGMALAEHRWRAGEKTGATQPLVDALQRKLRRIVGPRALTTDTLLGTMTAYRVAFEYLMQVAGAMPETEEVARRAGHVL